MLSLGLALLKPCFGGEHDHSASKAIVLSLYTHIVGTSRDHSYLFATMTSTSTSSDSGRSTDMQKEADDEPCEENEYVRERNRRVAELRAHVAPLEDAAKKL